MLRGIGKTFGGLIFCTFLVGSVFIASLIELTEYNNLKTVATDLFSKQLTENITTEEIRQMHSLLLLQCADKETIELSLGEKNVTLDCSKLRGIEAEDIIPFIATAAFDEIYYEEYECEFIQCLQKEEGLMVLASAHANNFFKSIQNFVLIGTIIGAVILFVSIKNWSGRLTGFGTLLIFTGIPYFFLGFFKGFIPAEVATVASPLVNQIMSSLSTKLLIIFIVGVILAISGYFLKYLSRKKTKKK